MRGTRSAVRSRWLWSLFALVGCSSGVPVPPPAAPLTSPTNLCPANNPTDPCRSALEIERLLRSAPLSIEGHGKTPGSSGAQVLTLRLSPAVGEPVTLRAKWRELGDSFLNDARKEIAAYAVQKVFLEPHEYVVPPTVGRCFPIQSYQSSLRRQSQRTFPGFPCVFGSLSYWLENVKSGQPYSPRRFREDPDYRQAMADANLFTFLVQHGDTHAGNFLVLDNERTMRVFSPDNAIAFNPYFRNPLDLLNPSWYDLRVPALRKTLVKRLAAVERAELDWLRAIENFDADGGKLKPVPPARLLPGNEPIRTEASSLQLGLAASEIDRLHERIGQVLAKVKSGEVGLF